MLCVIARIDEKARERLAALQDVAVELGVPPRPLYGHITLVTYVGDREPEFIAHAKAALREQRQFTAHYDRIGVLETAQVVAAMPKKEGELEKVQSLIAVDCTACVDAWTRPSLWIPHTTLAHRPPVAIDVLADAMSREFEPFSTRVDRIEFSRVLEDGYAIVDAVDLKK